MKRDPRSGKLWADHQDLQIVANVYKINVHILTVGIDSPKGPKARWTQLLHDIRLKSLNGYSSKMVDDIWLFHQDKIHYDLIIRKDSVHALTSLCTF